MKFPISKSLGLIAATAMLSGVAFAANHGSAAPNGSLSHIEGNAELLQPISIKSAAQGQAVTLKLTSTILTPAGNKLPSGTELIGQIASVTPNAENAPATLALTFDQARLKNGKTLPIHATLISVAPAGSDLAADDNIQPDSIFEQEPGAFSGVSMRSAMQESLSGTITDTRRNLKLNSGTEFIVAVRDNL